MMAIGAKPQSGEASVGAGRSGVKVTYRHATRSCRVRLRCITAVTFSICICCIYHTYISQPSSLKIHRQCEFSLVVIHQNGESRDPK